MFTILPFGRVLSNLLLFQHAGHQIVPSKSSKLFNRLTEINLDIDLGNLKEAQAAHCLFQNAPNLQRIELQVRLLEILAMLNLKSHRYPFHFVNALYFAAYLQGSCRTHVTFLGLD